MRVIRPIIPRMTSLSLSSESIPRLHVSLWNASLHGSRPILLEGIIHTWPAATLWQPEALVNRFKGVTFAVGHEGDESLTLAAALEGTEEPPPYVFDALFAEAHPELTAEYSHPAPFPPEGDFLAHLSSFAALRPRWRWFLAGRRGTGIGIHVDPHGTHAWNALVVGSKRWALLPPTATPADALRGSRDESGDSAALRSAAAWFETCLPKLRADAHTVGLLECVQRAGEVLYIPNGWWHTAIAQGAINIGVTHNFLDAEGFAREEAALIKRGGTGRDVASAWRGRLESVGLLPRRQEADTTIIAPSFVSESDSTIAYSAESAASTATATEVAYEAKATLLIADKPSPSPALLSLSESASESSPRTLLVGGPSLSLDELGPIVINTNGTTSRITNWDALSQGEQERSRKLVAKRNAERLIVLRAAACREA